MPENLLASDKYHGGPLQCNLSEQSFAIGRFIIAWRGPETGHLVIQHADDPKRLIWSNVPGVSFLTAAHGTADVRDSRGFFRIKDRQHCCVKEQVIECFAEEEENALLLSGRFSDASGSTWKLRFRVIDESQLSMDATASVDGKPYNRLCLVAASRPEEQFFGFGAQFTHLQMKGRRIPVISQEPGIGRGIQPLTSVMEKIAKAGGHWWNSYAPSPMFISTDLRAFCLENTEYSVFDLCASEFFRVGTFADILRGRIFFGTSPLHVVEAYTRFCGRMKPIPAWTQNGAIIGMQGGTSKVRTTLAKLEANNANIAGFWLQDWVGKRKTAIGSQLWWNWEVDQDQYPGWDDLVAELRSKDLRVLTYLNPFLVDASNHRNLKHGLYEEAREGGYFIRQADGSPYQIMNTTFSASMLDLTNPEACLFLKRVIREHVLGAGPSGWMADYAEALPFDAQLHSGQDAASYHNQYPIEWAKINREAIAEEDVEGDVLFFTRSGYHRSPAYSTCFWLGDQLTSWRQEDGIKSVVVGLMSSGLSGMSYNHADIGGYTTTSLLPFRIPSLSYSRSQELLMRWIELSAFTPLFRTHEGNIPAKNHQITDSEAAIVHFAKFSRVFAALAPYRQQLAQEALEKGYPLVRHPWLHYPHDAEIRKLQLQFLLGSDFMVAPVLDAARENVRLYLPQGEWIHLWSKQKVAVSGPTGQWFVCTAPMGAPPVFFVAASKAGCDLAEKIAQNGLGGSSPWSSPACIPAEDESRKPSRSTSLRALLACPCRCRSSHKVQPELLS
eukprot:TRINITY_DN749_c0_g1_i1.p1 TRINITY_DN749_c0_g1~~TRINITY_DN749_c0_g1_i1.p1  ORF type:complete len:804 (+),score=100.83 TRINITY_DN749_c0_g1_i1:67-2412(+)